MARYLGADAALGYVGNYYLMTESDACSILTDADPAVLDRYPAPTLAGECAGDSTPHSVAGDVLERCSCAVGAVACDEDYGDVEGRIADAWEQGRDQVWDDALHTVALRALGGIARADDIERDLEAQAATLRQKAWS